MKVIKIILMSYLLLGVISCKKEALIDETKGTVDNLQKSTTVSALVAVVNPFTPPTGWTIVRSATSAKLMRPTNANINVIVVNLKNNNGQVIPLYDAPTPNFASSTTPSPLFPKGDIWFWWNKNPNVFAVANGPYFDRTYYFVSGAQIQYSTTELSHALQQSWSLRSTGKLYGVASNQRWLCFNNGYATIGDGPTVPISTNYYASASSFYKGVGPTVLGGLHPVNANADPNTAQGRTMVGIKDCDGDGLKEVAYILTADNLTQSGAYNILKNTFACDQVVMFDGGGSTQMICKGYEYVTSSDYYSYLYNQKRKFPVALRVTSN